MSAESIFLFFILCFSLGHSLDLILGNFSYSFTGILLKIGFGLSLIPVIAVIFDIITIPLSIYYLIFIGVIFTALSHYLNRSNIHLNRNNSINIFPLFFILSLTIVSLLMYVTGSFSYTYMEDGDSWLYTTVSKMIAENQTFKADYRYNHVSEPYTQGYQIVLALIHQTNDSIYWTVKFFNSLFAALSLPFFYLLALEVFKHNKNTQHIALISTFMLFAVPSWLTHHIYSMTLNVALLPLLFYSFLKSTKEWRWSIVSGFILGSMVLNHFFTALVSILFFLYTILLLFLYGNFKLKPTITTAAVVSIISLCFYIPSSLMRHGYYKDNPLHESHGGIEMLTGWFGDNTSLIIVAIIGLISLGLLLSSLRKRLTFFHKKTSFNLTLSITIILLTIFIIPEEQFIHVKGCCSRIYSINDFLFPQVYNLMHNPIGWGIVYSFFVALGCYFIIRDMYTNSSTLPVFMLINLFVITFLLVHGMRLSIGLMTFRMWTFMTLFSALLAGYGSARIFNYVVDKLNRKSAYILSIIAFIGLTGTSYAVKYDINTKPWPDHVLYLESSHKLHAWVRDNIPKNSRVINVCRDSSYLISYDMLPPVIDKSITPPWREDHPPSLYEMSYELDTQSLHKKLKELEITYIVVGFSCIEKDQQRDDIVKLVHRIQTSKYFKIIRSSESDMLLEVN